MHIFAEVPLPTKPLNNYQMLGEKYPEFCHSIRWAYIRWEYIHVSLKTSGTILNHLEDYNPQRYFRPLRHSGNGKEEC